MSKKTALLVSLALSALLSPALAWAVATGDPIPMKDAKLTNYDGHETTIADVHGSKGTLVVFTCNHCPYAKAWEDRIVALGNEYSKKGIGVIAINSNDSSAIPEDGIDQMKQHATGKSYGFAYAVDSTSGVAKAFGATKTPEVFLFDASGKLAYHGAIDDNSADAGAVKSHYLKDALDSVAGGKPVAVAETKALGCGIKFR
ncbi:MAG TPA: thioredoxin family protein [Candidatus Binatia bacterium]|jgi:peroxiredoxin